MRRRRRGSARSAGSGRRRGEGRVTGASWGIGPAGLRGVPPTGPTSLQLRTDRGLLARVVGQGVGAAQALILQAAVAENGCSWPRVGQSPSRGGPGISDGACLPVPGTGLLRPAPWDAAVLSSLGSMSGSVCGAATGQALAAGAAGHRALPDGEWYCGSDGDCRRVRPAAGGQCPHRVITPK